MGFVVINAWVLCVYVQGVKVFMQEHCPNQFQGSHRKRGYVMLGAGYLKTCFDAVTGFDTSNQTLMLKQ